MESHTEAATRDWMLDDKDIKNGRLLNMIRTEYWSAEKMR